MTDRVTEYARLVVAGKSDYPVGKLHIAACRRHIEDLERQKTDDFPYYWDVEAADEILCFAETLTIAEGDEPKPVHLYGSQAFDLGCVFGWKKCSNGKRRFRRSYESMARQQGKTFRNGIKGTYIGGFGGYRYGKLFCAATKKRQSKLAWEEMAKFIRVDPDLSELFKIKDYVAYIESLETGCTIEALSREGGLDDGFRSIYCSVDEIHQHKDNKVYKALYNGTRKLPETLISMITTRGDNLNSFCKEMDDYAKKILRREATAEDFFVDIYCPDDGDDIKNEATWAKANPITCYDPDAWEVLRQDARTAFDMGGADLRDFITKSLNMWVRNADNQAFNPDAWNACASDRTIEDIAATGRRRCIVGLDLSSGGDLTSLFLEFDTEGEEPLYLYSHSFMPAGRLQEHIETDVAPYDLWEEMGLLTATGSEMSFMTDYDYIIAHLRELKERYALEFAGIALDPHNAAALMQRLEEFGCPVVLITQSARSLNDATVDAQNLVKSRLVEYDRRNELLTWSILNATTVMNSFKEIKLDKKPGAKNRRIDVADAWIDAHALRLLHSTEERVAVTSTIDSALAEYLKTFGGGIK